MDESSKPDPLLQKNQNKICQKYMGKIKNKKTVGLNSIQLMCKSALGISVLYGWLNSLIRNWTLKECLIHP